jgi:signal transduction histidine kinase/CheY-like chemotaxis protein
VNRYLVKLRHANGSVRDVTISTVGVTDAAGRIEGYQGIARDVTDMLHMEREHQRAQRLESVGILAGGIAHEFNNFLAAIEGNLSMCRRATDASPEMRRNMQEAEEATEKARRLTMQFLTFAEGGEPVKKPLDLGRVAVENAEFALRGSRHRLRFEFAEDLCLVDADRDQIGQAVSTLVAGSVRAAPEGDTIVVMARNVEVAAGTSALKPGWYALLSVLDTGPAIPPEQAAHAFDPFYATVRDARGLDLPVVYSIARRHGGSAAVSFLPGKGHRVEIWLPVAASCPAAEAASREKPDDGATARRSARILIMDDEDMIRRMLGRMLQRLGYRTEAEADGAAAVARYKQALEAGKPFDAVILDLTVPDGMGGRETFERLRQVDPDVRAVVSSGYSSDPVMAHYGELGLAGVIAKPFRLEDLDALLQSVLRGA